RAAGVIHGGFQLLVIGRGVKGLLGGAALGALLLEIGGIKSAKAVLIIAPGAQAEKFAVGRPRHRQQEQKSGDQDQAAERPADDGVVLLRGQIRQRTPPLALVLKNIVDRSAYGGTKRDSSAPNVSGCPGLQKRSH